MRERSQKGKGEKRKRASLFQKSDARPKSSLREFLAELVYDRRIHSICQRRHELARVFVMLHLARGVCEKPFGRLAVCREAGDANADSNLDDLSCSDRIFV